MLSYLDSRVFVYIKKYKLNNILIYLIKLILFGSIYNNYNETIQFLQV